MAITKQEQKALDLLVKTGKTVKKLSRRSDAEYDIEIHGYNGELGCEYSAWLPLAIIYEAMWPDYIGMSDYPDMDGDWSAIRDSENGTIMNILKQALLELGLTE